MLSQSCKRFCRISSSLLTLRLSLSVACCLLLLHPTYSGTSKHWLVHLFLSGVCESFPCRLWSCTWQELCRPGVGADRHVPMLAAHARQRWPARVHPAAGHRCFVVAVPVAPITSIP